jgi:acetyl esterase/lipase
MPRQTASPLLRGVVAGLWSAVLLGVGLSAAVPPAHAQPSRAVAARNRAMGSRIDLPAALRTYAPLQERPPYTGVRITRDIAYGTDPHYRLDVFAPLRPARPSVPVVIFATGGQFTRRIHAPDGAAFYDNVMLWAARHGMVGVNADRHSFRGRPWQTGPQDMATLIDWVQRHIGHYGGDPGRVVFLGHGFGGTQIVSYLAHRQYWCCHGPGIAALVLISAPLNLAPLTSLQNPEGDRAASARRAASAPGAAPAIPLFDPAHSDLGELGNLTLPVFIGEPQYDGAAQRRSATLLQQRLCRLGRCPELRFFGGHNHLSVMLSFNTADASVSGPVLAWIRALWPPAQTRH